MTAEGFIKKLMVATVEGYPDISDACYSFLMDEEEVANQYLATLSKYTPEVGYIPAQYVLKMANAGEDIVVMHDNMSPHMEYMSGSGYTNKGGDEKWKLMHGAPLPPEGVLVEKKTEDGDTLYFSNCGSFF